MQGVLPVVMTASLDLLVGAAVLLGCPTSPKLLNCASDKTRCSIDDAKSNDVADMGKKSLGLCNIAEKILL